VDVGTKAALLIAGLGLVAAAVYAGLRRLVGPPPPHDSTSDGRGGNTPDGA
jgi:hypothetical protein